MSQNQNNGMFGVMEKYLMTPLTKLSQTKLVRAIQSTGVTTIPFTIVGSMFLVFNILPTAIPGLTNIFEATFFRFSELYMIANKATMGVLALYFTIALGYHYTRIMIEDDPDLDLDPIYGATLALFGFVMTIPQIIWEDGYMKIVHVIEEETMIINGWSIGADGVSRFGSIGVFVGIIMAIIAVHIYKFCVEKNIIIKMPAAVPSGVANSFTALIPTFIVAFSVLIINALFVFLGTDIFQVIQLPFAFVTNLTGSWLGFMVILFLIHALWSVGVHGATIITSIINPILINNMALNASGQATETLAGEFWNAYTYPGGSGSTLLLTFIMATLCRSQQLKILGRSSSVPAIFNINEPVIFGVPMIYNPDMLIPFILAPMVAGSIAYWATELGFVQPIIALMPWPTPVGIGAFISTGDWRAIIVALICVLAAGLVYYPFIMRFDKKLYAEELEKAAKLAAEGSDEGEQALDDFFSLD
ncbi:PTS cellobiose transporter subunit IIC [Aerococcus kribbianus]|uniref:Permease IIC component n=1 Tax=Aerococcus kribbianus TaxID=2999064 RepID=A0A9X3FNC2_9LACT|nr:MULTISPECIES: PTS cellobiose transporter subunit IIC [unclassified Aerococcus]MCZ0717595.1 PTS cellobiose transporter subunit IIC [Aerococcus sp. YH-aer221]MCZ0725883.1 PTS cellobiose transporter subunit IIC [Aerococcus sp. YH-aer222]